MQTYIVNSPDFSAILIRDADLIVQTAPILSWACGLEFSKALRYIEQRGWRVQPLVEENEHTRWIEIDGAAFELHWQGDSLRRVTLHQDGSATDLCYEQIPESLQRLIL